MKSLLCSLAVLALAAGALSAQETTEIPVGGNAFVTAGDRAADVHHLADPARVISVYFHSDRAAQLRIVVNASSPDGPSRLRLMVTGKTSEIKVTNREAGDLEPVTVQVVEPGYVRVDLQSAGKAGEPATVVESLKVTGTAKIACVRDNGDNRFYWGRRGPSVHLGYKLPEGVDSEYFYNEVTVPEGSDPVGSYFMANGFGEGYFGMQVNSDHERRVLFSVWSPFTTDHPEKIPDDQKVTLLKKGDEVHGGEFGGEGSGGQSYWIYPWQAGVTYRFLNRAHPDGSGGTVYTAWFSPVGSQTWKLIASFRRPQTAHFLTGVHSFLENFSDIRGDLGRRAQYANQWCRDTSGAWHRIKTAHFSGDDIASRGWRLDFEGGVTDQGFFLRNGGFFEAKGALGAELNRPEGAVRPSEIDFKSLEESGN